MGRKSISIAVAIAAALFAANPARAQTIIDDWNCRRNSRRRRQLKPVTLVPKETALLVMDFTVQTCTPERRKRCAEFGAEGEKIRRGRARATAR